MNNYQYLEDNLATLQQRMVSACQRSNRDPSEITLLAVCKTVDPIIINRSIELGITNLGENKPQEIRRKYSEVTSGVNWHMIGHLQSNKVKMIIDKVSLIHSVDRQSVVDEIEKRAAQIEKAVDVLVQVNIGRESQKSGVAITELEQILSYIDNCQHIKVRGLMCIAPYLENAQHVRPYFKKMRQLFDELKNNGRKAEMEILSMGMSHDCEVAIEEGATMIRVGTAIYGERNY